MSEEIDVFDVLKLVANRHRDRLMQMANVTGVGVGYKKVKGVRTNIPAIIVFVSKKLPVSQLAPKDIVPPTLDGFQTDVVEAVFQAMSKPPRTSRIRPAVGGISVGNFRLIDDKPTAGTLTDIMTDYINRRKVVCSNNHVIALCAPFGPGQVGDQIYQPGTYDGGTSEDTIATLERYVPLKSVDNLVDGAIATPLSDDLVSVNHYDFGPISGPYAKAKPGMVCQKGGRTTGLTTGQVTAVEASFYVGYGPYGSLLFLRQIVIESETVFVQPGDSGSLAVERDSKRPVGVLFAGSGDGLKALLNDFSVFSIMLKVGYLPVLKGRVVNKDGKPIQHALVSIPALGIEWITPEDGTFMFGNLTPHGKITLKVFHPQYKTYETELTLDAGFIDVGDITLEKAPPTPPSLSLILSDAVAYISYLLIFSYVVTPELISAFKEMVEID